MSDSIFTKIIKGEIPAYKIYEDDKTLAFLDINPIQPGHTLVVPKKQVEFVWDLEAEDYHNLMNTVKKVALELRKKSGFKYVGQKIIGVDVPHAHVHLIPFNTADQFIVPEYPNKEPDHTALKIMAEKLKFN